MKTDIFKSNKLNCMLSYGIRYASHFAILFSFLLTSGGCDCVVDGNGIVVDSETNLPLDSVVVKSYVDKVKNSTCESEMITDSTGKFSGSTGLTGGGFSGCPDLVVELSKNGYLTTSFTNPYNDTVKLIKE